MQIIHENEYEEIMKNIVTPYLLSHRRELYVPGADYPFRNESKRITGKIHMLQYLSDIDMPKGVVVISHGFTESAVKYDEVAYYFLRKAIMYIFRSIAPWPQLSSYRRPVSGPHRYMEKIYPRFSESMSLHKESTSGSVT